MQLINKSCIFEVANMSLHFCVPYSRIIYCISCNIARDILDVSIHAENTRSIWLMESLRKEFAMVVAVMPDINAGTRAIDLKIDTGQRHV